MPATPEVRHEIVTTPSTPEAVVRKPGAAIERIDTMYNAFLKDRFDVTQEHGVTLKHPLLPTPGEKHHITSATVEAHVQRKQMLTPQLRTLLTFLPRATAEASINQNLEEKALAVGTWALDIPGTLFSDVGNMAKVFSHETSHHKGDFIHGLTGLASHLEDEVTFHFTHFLAGDPIAHTKTLEEKGFTHHSEALHYQKQIIYEGMRQVLHPEKQAHEVAPIWRLVSAVGKWDALTDIAPLVNSLRRALKGRIHDEALLYGLAFGIDLSAIPSPGIDAPSIKPFLKTEVLAKAMLGTELMQASLQKGNGDRTAIGWDLFTGHVEIAKELKEKYPRQVKKLQGTVDTLSRKALGLRGKQDVPALSTEAIMQNSNLTSVEKNRLIMGQQLVDAFTLAQPEIDINEAALKIQPLKRRGRKSA